MHTMNDEETTTSEDRIDGVYASQFRRHLNNIQAHFRGQDQERLLPSFVLPTGFWTSEEKDAFFHALGVHSRLRPDLIATSIGTKTVLDVCTYINLLEDSISQQEDAVISRSDYDVSMEMSESWVEWEEDRALRLVAPEAQSVQGHIQHEEAGSTSSLPRDTLSGCSVDVAATRQRKSQQAILGSIDLDTLQVMERIINEAEEDLNLSRSDNMHRSSEDPSPDPSPRPSLVPSSTELNSSNDAMIADPIAGTSQSAQVGLSSTEPTTFREGTSNHAPCGQPDDHGEPNLSQLSPRSRRKLQKRLYMRRRRAAQNGGELNTAASKLRPGRKTVMRPADNINAWSTIDDIPESPDTNEKTQSPPAKAGKRKKKHSLGGITKPYKIKKELVSKGIDRRLLTDEDLCIFHLSTFGRLMNLYRAGYEEASSDTVSAISAETIRVFSTIMTDFVSKLIFHTINLQENQRRVKEGTLVYRLGGGDIKAPSVERAKRLMGIQDMTVRKYFSQLLAERAGAVESTTDEEEDGEVDHEHEAEVESEDVSPVNLSPGSEGISRQDKKKLNRLDCPTDYPIRLPLHRELNPPLVNLPKTSTSSLSHLDDDADDLLPELMDEDELARELQEDDELDSRDRKAALEYEVALWKEFCQEPVVH